MLIPPHNYYCYVDSMNEVNHRTDGWEKSASFGMKASCTMVNWMLMGRPYS